MTPAERNSLMADVLEEVADLMNAASGRPFELEAPVALLALRMRDKSRERAQALRSTPERANLADAGAEQPAGGQSLFVAKYYDRTPTFERSPEAEAVIAAARRLDAGDHCYITLREALAALDRKGGVT
jgi:hypothetical protein